MSNKEFDRSLENLKKQADPKMKKQEEKENQESRLTLKRKEKKKKISRNYVLKQKHIDFIDRAARKTQRNKSEIVQIALEYLEENIEYQ